MPTFENNEFKITLKGLLWLVGFVITVYGYFLADQYAQTQRIASLEEWRNQGGRFTAENGKVLEKDISHNREGISEIKNDIKEIKQDVKKILMKK